LASCFHGHFKVNVSCIRSIMSVMFPLAHTPVQGAPQLTLPAPLALPPEARSGAFFVGVKARPGGWRSVQATKSAEA
jgi:hypothetical protein